MNYECDYTMLESKAWENRNDRTAFNDKFYTIYDNEARDRLGVNSINLSYQNVTENGVNTSKLQTTQGSLIKDEFKMHAKTAVVKETTSNLDFALVEREEADLALSLGLMNKNNVKVRNYVNTFFSNDGTKNISNIITVDGQIYMACKVDVQNQGAGEMYVRGLTFNCNTDSRIWFDMNQTQAMNDNLLQLDDITYFGNINSGLQIQWNGDPLYVPAKSSKSIYLVFNIPQTVFEDNTEVPFKAAVDLIGYISPNGIIDKDSQPNNLNLDQSDYSGNFEDDSFKMEKILRIN